MPEKFGFNYAYQEYDGGVFGKCIEMPAITAQARTQDEVYRLLHEMTNDYLELIKKKV